MNSSRGKEKHVKNKFEGVKNKHQNKNFSWIPTDQTNKTFKHIKKWSISVYSNNKKLIFPIKNILLNDADNLCL